MTIKEIEAKLKPWLESYEELERAYDTLNSCLGADGDSPVIAAMYRAHVRYTDTLAELLDCSSEWTLSWYLLENDCGRKGMKAGIKGRLKPIRNLKDLAKLIKERA